MVVLGIETSCDETAAAVVRIETNSLLEDGPLAAGGERVELLSNVVATSMDLHAVYGGVVPEIAARSHIESILPVIDQALTQAFGSLDDKDSPTEVQRRDHVAALWDRIDAIAVTYGAGLGGSLLVGVMTAKTLALVKQKPLYGINHVEGHVYANFITDTTLPNYVLPASQPTFPLLALIVSGGHSQLALFKDHFSYTLLGRTRDDAIGEAFDKVAKILGLPYPGGPSIAKAAELGDPLAYQFPKAQLDTPYDFSFSGLKTAVLRCAQSEIGEDFTFPSYKLPERLSELQKHNLAASFQRVAIVTVVDKTIAAYKEHLPRSIVLAGGVAANQELRRQLKDRLSTLTSAPELHVTDMKLCTDNGAMIATLGCFKAVLGQPAVNLHELQIEPNLKM